jgi:two-component system NtrC family sensor kinase
MAKSKTRAGRRAVGAGGSKPRARKSVASKASKAAAGRPKPLESTSRKRQPAPEPDTAELKKMLHTARVQQQASAEILRAVANAAGDAAKPLQLIAETTARLFDAASVSIQLAEGHEFTQEYRVGAIAKRIGSAYPRSNIKVGGRNLPGTVVAESRQIHIPDLDHLDPSMSDFPGLPHARAGGARTVCGTPLRREGKAIGALIVFRDRLMPFTDDELALQQTFADQAVIAIENARLFNETKEALERQTATSDILRIINQSPSDVTPVFDAIAERARVLCGALLGATTRFDGELLHLVGYHGVSPQAEAVMRSSFPRKPDPSSINGRCILAKGPVEIADVEIDPHYQLTTAAKAAGYRSLVAVPMLLGGEVIGVIAVTRKEPGEFPTKLIELLQTFADQAVIAVENARLFDEVQARTRDLQESLQQQTATAEVLQVTSNSPGELQPVFKAVLENATRLCEARFGTLFRFDGDAFYFAADAGTPEAMAEYVRRPGPFQGPAGGMIDRIQKTRQVQHAADYAAEPVPGVAARLGGARTTLGVPILRDDVLVGAIVIYRQEVRPFTDREIGLVRSFAAQAAIAIENARLFNETKETLQHQIASADVLQVIGKSMADAKPVFERIVESLERLVTHRQIAIFLAPGDGLLHMVAGVGPDKEAVLAHYPRPIEQTAAPTVMDARRQVYYPDVLRDPDAPKSLRLVAEAAGNFSDVLTPMLWQDRAIGMIAVTREPNVAFSERELSLLRTFADQAVIAIENARLFEEVQARTRDLEDSLQQQKATSEVLQVISSSIGDLKPVFEKLLENATRVCGAEFSVMNFYEDGLYRDVATYNVPPAFASWAADKVFRPHPESGLARIVRLREVIQTEDLRETPGYREGVASSCAMADLAGARTVVNVPMIRDSDLIGTITIFRQEVRSFTDKQLELLKNFANQAVIAIENARLLIELRESLQQQTASAEVLQIISNSPGELQPVFRAVLEHATRICDARFGTLFRFEDDAFHFAADVGTPAALAEYVRRPGPFRGVPGGMIDRIHKTRQLQHAADYAAEPVPGLAATLGGARTTLGVPILGDDVLVGAIVIYRQEVRPFTDREIDLVRSFATQAAIAIENARLFNETKQALERQTATSDILKVIASSPDDVQPVFDAIASSARRLIGGFSTAVHLVIDDMVHLVAFTPTTPEADAILVAAHPRHRSEVGAVALVEHGEIAQIADSETADEHTRQLGRARGWRSLTLAPLMNQGDFIGFIACTRRETGVLGNHHVELLRTFADQAVIAIENARLFDEVQAKTRDLEESLQQQTATADVLKVISRSAFDLDAVMNTLARSAAELCAASLCGLHIREGDFLVCRGYAGATKEQEEFVRQARIPADDKNYLMSRVLSSCEVANIGDFESLGSLPIRTFQEKLGFNSLLMVPLMREGRGIGLFVLGRPRSGEFSSRHIELVKTFADQAVIAIENARLFDEVQAKTRDLTEALTYQTGSANILNVIASSPTDVTPVLKAIVDSACEVCEAHDAAVLLRDGDDLRFSAHRGPIPIGLEKWPINRRWTAGRAFIDQQTIHIEDLCDDRHAEFSDGRELSLRMGHRTIVSVPLLRDRESIGAIVLRRVEVNPFSDKQIALLQTFADQAVIALGNVRLFEEVQAKTRDLTEALQQQTATADVLKVISRSVFDLQNVLETLIKSAVELSGANRGSIFLREGEVFPLKAASSTTPEFLQYWAANPPRAGRGSATSRVIASGKVEIIPDVLADPEVEMPSSSLKRIRGALGVPMLRDEKVEGVLVLTRPEPGPFTQSQIDLVQTFADQAMIAIENARLFDEVQARTRELAKSLEELRTAQDRLIQTEKLASLGQLTAGIAHEIKNPLNFVNNFSALSVELTDELNDLLKGAKISEDISKEVDELTSLLKDNLGKVVQHGRRADSIVKNMLLHSREGSGEHRPSDINALVEESLNLAYHGARAEKSQFNVTIERDLDPEAGKIEAFPQEITRVLLNLISNGFYAVSKRKAENGSSGFAPVVKAATRGLPAHVEIRIRDNGTGIPAEVKEKMFNPFFTTKPAGEGTGLGLSMSHDIVVKQHGGTIDVETVPGEFTEFTIRLPRTSDCKVIKRGEA